MESETVQNVIEQAYTKVNGEYEVIVESSDDFKTYLSVLNQVMRQWASTPYIKWQSLFKMDYELPDAVALDKFDYPFAPNSNIRIGNTPFDGVYFLDDDGLLVTKYKMTDQAFFDASQRTNICMMASNGLQLKAIDPKMVGTSIRLPVYVNPPKYTTANEVVKIDSVAWLICEMAGFICDSSPVPFIARNADKYHKEALVFMKTMRDDNRKRQHLVIKSLTGADNGTPIGTEELISLLGANGILGGGGGVIDGGSA